ncbi:MAG: hypothetical protein LBQ15_04885 [Clostridium sp.]|jgi:hypothetical protein|nr:hypothetical protein [Clostridium sp.]
MEKNEGNRRTAEETAEEHRTAEAQSGTETGAEAQSKTQTNAKEQKTAGNRAKGREPKRAGMGRLREKTAAFAKTVLLLAVLLVFAFFVWESFVYSNFTVEYHNDWVKRVYIRKDTVWVNTGVLCAVFLAAFGAGFLNRKFSAFCLRAEKILLCAVCLLVSGLSLWWALASRTTPEGDQLIISAAAVYAGEGNFEMLTKGGYLNLWPQQLGLVGLYELIFGLTGPYSYRTIWGIHALLNGLTVFLGYRFLKEHCGREETSAKERIFKGELAGFWYLLLMLVCFPYFIHTSYVYGDIPSICLCMLLFWAAAKLEKTRRKRYIAWICIAGASAVLVRKNSLIVICAMVIGLLLMALETKRAGCSLGKGKLHGETDLPRKAGFPGKIDFPGATDRQGENKPRRKESFLGKANLPGNLVFLWAALLLILSVSGLTKGVETLYEIRSGYQVDGGIPAILYVAMGMQGDEATPGRFNNYTKATYYEADCNQKLATEVAKDYIYSRIEQFRADPGMMIDFYKMKALIQWNEPLFESLVSTARFEKEPEGIVEDIYYGELQPKLFWFCDRYQSVIYTGALLASCVTALSGKRAASWYLPMIAIVGGFLFSLLWESQPRYVLPYFVFAILYAAYGLGAVGNLADFTQDWTIRLEIKRKTEGQDGKADGLPSGSFSRKGDHSYAKNYFDRRQAYREAACRALCRFAPQTGGVAERRGIPEDFHYDSGRPGADGSL